MWRKSSHSAANGDCVEVSDSDSSIGVRDSKNVSQPALRFTADEWRSFIQGVKSDHAVPVKTAG